LKHTVEVTVLNQQYIIKSEASDAEVAAVASYVNEQLDAVNRGSRSVDTLHNVVLALLNVSGNHLKLLNEVESLKQQNETLERSLADAAAKIKSELECL
jgi:cell division protein ZapA (FtsZ GTPase activity inhibitor)